MPILLCFMFTFCYLSLSSLWTASLCPTFGSWLLREDLKVLYWTILIICFFYLQTINIPKCIKTSKWAAESFFLASLSCQSLKFSSASACFSLNQWKQQQLLKQSSFSPVLDSSILICTKSMKMKPQIRTMCATVSCLEMLMLPDTSGLKNTNQCADSFQINSPEGHFS